MSGTDTEDDSIESARFAQCIAEIGTALQFLRRPQHQLGTVEGAEEFREALREMETELDYEINSEMWDALDDDIDYDEATKHVRIDFDRLHEITVSATDDE